MIVRYTNDPIAERFYAAEMRVRDLNLPAEKHFDTLADIQAYVTNLQSRSWAWAPAAWAVDVRFHNLQTANYLSGSIFVPQLRVLFELAARELVILHELAHHFAGPIHGHDDAFTAAFVDLVHGMMPFAAERLQRELTKQGVPYARQP
jgi:putative metallohydrolase (TIGR04338 family)